MGVPTLARENGEKKCRWSSKAVEIARLAGTVPRSTLEDGWMDGAQKRRRLEIAMAQKKALLERLFAKSTRLNGAARKKEICILNLRFRKLNINNEYIESTQPVQEVESLDSVEQEVEVTGYMLGGISLGKDLSACSVDLDIVINYNQQEVSTMVQTGIQELPVPQTHSAQLRMFDKIRALQQQLSGRKGGTCLNSMRGPVGM